MRNKGAKVIMNKERTILEAIQIVCKDVTEGMTYTQIYQKIIEEKLYKFGAKNPQAVVYKEIRRHCKGVDFPTASPIKCFKIVKTDNKKYYYALLQDERSTEDNSKENDVYVIDDEMLPEERIDKAYQHYVNDLGNKLLDQLRACHPSFFEKIVVDLILSMGYGYDDKAGWVNGKSHDGGIDGIISEDKLGLNLIYIQAKRYNEGNNVGRPEVQRFIGAMQKAERGVFITTSKFTKDAEDFANKENRKHIRLIDGESFVRLMIKQGVGLERVKEYTIYKINEDYFTDSL